MAPIVPIDPLPRAVLFDLDDTLCDYAAARRERLRIAFTMAPDGELLARDGINIDAMIAESIETQPHGADHFPELFTRYGVEDPAEAHAAADWYRTNRFHGLQYFPETREVLRMVRRDLSKQDRVSGQPLGVITNGPSEVQRAKLDLLGVHDLVDFAIISEEFGVAKPNPEIFRAALQRADVGPDEALFVGDSIEFDMAGAHAAGIPSVWLNRLGRAWTESDWRPCREIRSLDELLELLDPGNG